MAHIHSGILLGHENDDTVPFAATSMDLEIFMLSEVRQTENDKYCVITFFVESKKMIQMNLFTTQKETHRCRKQTHGYTLDINIK